MKPTGEHKTTENASAFPPSGSDGPGISACVQCGQCSSSCGVAFVSAHTPRKVIRFLQWRFWDDAVHSPFLKLCKQCLVCTVRCPQGIDVAGVMRQLVRDYFIFR